MTKVCNYCGVEKKATSEFFGNRKQSKDGFEYGCKECRKLRWKKQKSGDNTWTSQKTLKFEAEKAEGFRTCVKCSVKKDFIEFKRTDGSTRAVCKSCHAKNQREQRASNKSEDLEYHSIRENLNGARKRAKKDGYPFDITIEDLTPFPTHCEISGAKLTYGVGDKQNGASLDKIVPSKGYVKGNVRIISQRVNLAKGSLTLNQIKRLIRYIEKHI